MDSDLKQIENAFKDTENSKNSSKAGLNLKSQVAQARYMSSYMLTFTLLPDSSDLHIYKDLYWERNKPEKKTKNYR